MDLVAIRLRVVFHHREYQNDYKMTVVPPAGKAIF
jgi:hypothetical protein